MLVCHCNGVSDRAIRKAIRKGARTASDVGMQTGAGTCCGGCLDAVNSILRTEAANARDRATPADIVSLPVLNT